MQEKHGVIKKEDYEQLQETLGLVGYDTTISILNIDENPSKKTSSDAVETVKIGENIYYVEHTTQIEDAFGSSEMIKLNEGDYVKFETLKANESIYDMLQRVLYGVSGGNIGRKSAGYTGLIKNSAQGTLVTVD